MSKTNKEIFEDYDETIWTKIVFDENTNGYVVVHQHHGKGELKVNLPIALKLAEIGFCVELLAETKVVQSADAKIDSEFWEFKTTKGTKSSIQNRLREGKYQSQNILLYVQTGFIIIELLRGIMSSISVDRTIRIQKIGLMFESRDELGLIVFSREEVRKSAFRKVLVHFTDEEDS